MVIRRIGPLAVAIVAVLALAACGSSGGSGKSGSGDAQALLKQTFDKSHTVRSGVLQFSLRATPSGSSTLTTPVTLTLNGPFQSRGSGQLPESNFTVGVTALGKQASFGVISTTAGVDLSLEGVAYRLPATDAAKIRSTLSGAGASGSGTSGLAGLGLHPLRWLTNPKIVGTETVGGVQTTHIRAHVNVPALIDDLNSFLASEAKRTSTHISPATARKIAASVRNPTVDVWTGKSDKTLRRLAINLDVPVTGRVSTDLGGMTSAAIAISVGYSQLNQPQTITPPAHPRSFAALQAKLRALGQQLEGALGGGAVTGGGSGGGSAGAVSKYSQCIQRAGGDVAKMQKCASLLNGSAQ